jgi:hypothetical protein
MTLYKFLKPMEIVALATATRFLFNLSKEEREKYMKWWRELFWTMNWVEVIGNNNVTIIGKHIEYIQEGLRKWRYIPTTNAKVLSINCSAWSWYPKGSKSGRGGY